MPVTGVALALVGNLATGIVKVPNGLEPIVLATTGILAFILVAAGVREGVITHRDRAAQNASPENPQGAGASSTDIRARYLDRVCARYERVGLDILAPLTERGEHPVMLLGKVFVPQSVRENPPPQELLNLPREVVQRLLKDGQVSELPENLDHAELRTAHKMYHERPALPVLEAFGQTTKAVVLGDPGAGKSTLGRYITLLLALDQRQPEALSWAQHALPSSWRGRLPLLIELRSYADARWRGKTFLDLVDEFWQTEDLGLPKDELDKFLRSGGHALVIFDGLDEIFDPRIRADVTRQIEGFAARYPGVNIIVTSRVIGYQDNRAVLDAAGFTTYMLQDLNRKQIGDFAKIWYDHSCANNPPEATRLRKRLLGAIERSVAIAELAGNPMLLTILAIMARRSELPRDRSTVYKHAVTVLIEDWDVNKHLREQLSDVTELDATDKLEMLHRVARRMQDASAGLAGNHLPANVLTKELRAQLMERMALSEERTVAVARAMLQQFQHRNFILSSFGAGLYGFVHRAFLEYLAADDIRQRFTDRELSEEALLDLIHKHAPDPSWSEVLLLLVGMIPEKFAIRSIVHLLATNQHAAMRENLPTSQLLALRALGEIRRLAALSPHASEITNFVIKLLRSTNQTRSRNSTIGSSVQQILPAVNKCPSWLDAPRYQAWHRISGRSLYLSLPRRQTALFAARLLVLTHSSNWVSIREQAVYDRNHFVRQAAVEVIARDCSDDPDTLPFLRERAINDDDEAVRRVAIRTIAESWLDSPSTLPWLHERAANDRDSLIRQIALQAIARKCPDNPDTLPFLRERAINDDDEAVRRVAIRTIAESWLDSPSTLPWLHERAANDRGWRVRGAAVEAISRSWSDGSGTLDRLRDYVTNDDNPAIRQAAVQAIAQDWSGDPDTLSFLRELAINDEAIRQTVIQVVTQNWPDTPDILSWLRDYVADDDWGVRRAVVQAIARDCADDPNALPLLRERALIDDDQDARRTAVQGIARNWPEDPETLPWLRERAIGDSSDEVRQSILRVITSIWPEDPDTLPWLRERAFRDTASSVRRLAIKIITENWPKDPGILSWLRERASSDNDGSVRQTAIEAIAEICPGDFETLSWLRERAIFDTQIFVRQGALQAITQNWPGDSDSLLWFQSHAIHDEDSVRWTAIEAVASGWSDSPEVHSWLRDHAINAEHNIIRQAAIRAIAQNWPDEPDVLSWLHERAIHDDDGTVRAAAVHAIARNWPDEADALEWLRDRAVNDDSWSVRRVAVQAIARNWRDAPDTFSWIRERAVNDDEMMVRRATVQVIARSWKEDALSWLRDRADSDADESVRQTAIDMAARYGRDEPDTLSWLRDRAVNGNNAPIRRAAIHAIAWNWRHELEVLPWLRDRAINDTDESVRQTAIESVARNWPYELEVLSWLRDRAVNDIDESVRQTAIKSIEDNWPDEPAIII
ncbi:HEAT repeat domain-containing protein [Actinomadura luteofluorescens]